MINVVLLLVFQCPDAQFWYMNTACYSTDELLYQNRCQKTTSKPNTNNPQCHWPPATPFQTVQNPDLRKLHNASKSCSRQKKSTKSMVSKLDHTTMSKKTHKNELHGWKHDGWALASVNTHHS